MPAVLCDLVTSLNISLVSTHLKEESGLVKRLALALSILFGTLAALGSLTLWEPYAVLRRAQIFAVMAALASVLLFKYATARKPYTEGFCSLLTREVARVVAASIRTRNQGAGIRETHCSCHFSLLDPGLPRVSLLHSQVEDYSR